MNRKYWDTWGEVGECWGKGSGYRGNAEYYNNYFHSTDIALGIISKLEMIQTI